ncbi:hypothetical protein Tco_0199744 [Tanacetum coccineum]
MSGPTKLKKEAAGRSQASYFLATFCIVIESLVIVSIAKDATFPACLTADYIVLLTCVPGTLDLKSDQELSSLIQLIEVLLPLLKQLFQEGDVRPVLYEKFHMPEWFQKHGIPASCWATHEVKICTEWKLFILTIKAL